MSEEKPKSISERMEDVSRSLVEAGLVDKDEAAAKYQEMQRKRETGLTSGNPDLDMAESRRKTQEALAEARAALERMQEKTKGE